MFYLIKKIIKKIYFVQVLDSKSGIFKKNLYQKRKKIISDTDINPVTEVLSIVRDNFLK